MLYSFDVFDTVITRKTATPQGVIKRMQKELLHNGAYTAIPEYVRKNFYALRIRIERLTRINYCYNGVEDISLSQIYEGFVQTGYVNEEQSWKLEELEIQTELDCVLGISENIKAIKKLKQAGQRVILISDMYLSERTIRRMLATVDPVLAGLPIYVSSEYKKSKWTGSLYPLVRHNEGAEYSQWIHMGDNAHSDVEIPKCLGIRASRFLFPEKKDMEDYILSEEKDSIYAEFAAGASRYVRSKKKITGAWSVGVTAGANILLPYVLWILDRAREQGIRRLYFVARDGYILKQMADKIIRANGDFIETHYIYGSRKAWRLPGISAANNDLVELLGWSHPPKLDTPGKLADALGITEAELLSFLPQGLEQEIRLSSYTLHVIAEHLNENATFKEFLFEKHKGEGRLVKEYLIENIDVRDNHFAFVELAGSGYTQKCLADMLAEIRRERYSSVKNEDYSIKTFYFKMDRINHWRECQQFVFLPEHNVKNLIVEMVCRACHGQTVGYEERNGHVQPILDREGSQLLDYKYDEYTEGILEYTDYVCEKNPQMLVWGQTEGLAVSVACLSYLLNEGESEEFLYYADMPNNLTGRADRAESFAPALTDKQLERIFYTERFHDREQIYHGTCFELSLERCDEKQKKKIKRFQEMAAEENRNRILDKTFENCFPVEILGGRIVLYGAGRYGNQLYDILASCNEKKVVQWIDRNYENIKDSKRPLAGPGELGQEEYDCILIGVVSKESADEIRAELISRGVPAWKIYWLGKAEVNQYLVWNQTFRWL